jgi:toxin ParE1/3/4
MSAYRLSFRARADLDEIWDYSVGKWGRQKATGYLRQIRHAVETVAEGPDLGMRQDEIRSGYQTPTVGSHVIFYRLGTAVEIVRILHQSMDVRLHLD